jgi:transcriptional regulator with XRE-family HTH domain
MSFGEKLKTFRLSKGLYQKELGEVLGTDQYSVINWEKDITLPAHKFRERIWEMAGIDLRATNSET